MEWVDILGYVAELALTGGLLAIVTIRDKKTAAILDNYDRVIKSWEETARERYNRAAELKADLDKKDKKIDELHAENGELHDKINELYKELDHERTERARAEMVKCNKLKCIDREPPYGYGHKTSNNV